MSKKNPRTAIRNVQEQYRHHDHSPIGDESNVEDLIPEEFKANERFSLVADNPSQQGKLHLPLCTAGNLIEIRDRLSQTTMPKSHAEFYANVIMETVRMIQSCETHRSNWDWAYLSAQNGLFLHKLIEIFSDLEDLDDTASLGRCPLVLNIDPPIHLSIQLSRMCFYSLISLGLPKYGGQFSCSMIPW